MWQEPYFNPCCDSLAAGQKTGKTRGERLDAGPHIAGRAHQVLFAGAEVPEPRALATALRRFPGRRIENQLPIEIPIRIKHKLEIEEIRDRPGQRVK